MKSGNNGLRYYIPFRGEGDYTLAAMVKDLNGVTLDEGVWIQMYPCGEDKKRNGSGSMFSLGSGNATGGYIPLSVTRRFADSEKNDNGEPVKTFWIEVRVLLLQNGDVVVSRMSLARNSTAIHWNANALGDTASRQQALESYTQQRAGSIEAGIRQGLKSVGFKMDSGTWTVNTWGNKFAWYATEADANKGTNAKMWLDTKTDTLHVKGDIETTGGSISFFTFNTSGFYSGSLGNVKQLAEGLGLQMDNLSISGSPGHNIVSSVYLGNGWKDSRLQNAGYLVSAATRVGDANPSHFFNYVKLEAINGTDKDAYNENNIEYAALGVETDGYVPFTALGGPSYFAALAFASVEVSGTVTADGKHTLYLCPGGSIFTLPKNPVNGLLIIVIQTSGGKVYFDGNGKRFRIGSNISGSDVKAYSNVNGQWSFFIYGYGYWCCNFIEPGNGMW